MDFEGSRKQSRLNFRQDLDNLFTPSSRSIRSKRKVSGISWPIVGYRVPDWYVGYYNGKDIFCQ